MPGYKNNATRERIYCSAKKLFHAYGYKKATIEKIAEDAQVPVGLVTYYFKKSTILSEIYKEYMTSIVEAIDRQAGDRLENHLQRHMLIGQLFYSCLVGDSGNKEVYREIFMGRLVSPEVRFSINNSLAQILKEFHLEIDEHTFEQMMVAEFGARRELLFHRYDTLSSQAGKDKDFFYFLSTIAARLVGISGEVIQRNIAAVDRILEDFDTTGIKFLV